MSTNVNACIYCGVVPGGYHTNICPLLGPVLGTSPVQGAASASGEAKGAAVKPWQERGIAGPRHATTLREAAIECELADWCALAERAQAAQPEAPALTQQGRDYDVEQAARAIESFDDKELSARLRYAWKAQCALKSTSAVAYVLQQRATGEKHLVWPHIAANYSAQSYEKLSLAYATPAPEKEAAQVGAVPVHYQQVVKAIQALPNPYSEQRHGAQWHASSHAWDMGVIDAMRAVSSLIADLAVPVAQEASQDSAQVPNFGAANTDKGGE